MMTDIAISRTFKPIHILYSRLTDLANFSPSEDGKLAMCFSIIAASSPSTLFYIHVPCLGVDSQLSARGVPSDWIHNKEEMLKKIPKEERVDIILEEFVFHAQVCEENQNAFILADDN